MRLAEKFLLGAGAATTIVHPTATRLGRSTRNRIAILHGLKVLGIKNEITIAAKNLITAHGQSHLRVLRFLPQPSADAVDRVAYEHRLYEAELVVAVAEGLSIVVSEKAQPVAKDLAPETSRLPNTPSRSAKIASPT